MTALVEDPKLVVFAGILALALLASILPRTQRYGRVFLAMAGVLLVTVAGVVVERLVVTEKEQIEATLDSIVLALEHNDLDGLLEFVSPSAVRTRKRATWALERILVTDTGIRNLEIVPNHLTSPPSAEARFDGVIRYRMRVAGFGREFYAARFVVELRLEDDRWVVTDHVEYQTQSL